MSQQRNSLRDSLYLTENPWETTFKYDNQLPNLPVPKVRASILKLLDSIRPIVDDDKVFENTRQRAMHFIEDPAVGELQKLLETRGHEHKNWLEEWWLEFAYLRSRKPLIPYSNMSAPLPIMRYWPIENGSVVCRAQRAALSTFFQLSFWRMLRNQLMRPMIHKGVPWSMNQFRFLFNTVRRPGEPKDELVSWFKTTNQGEPESCEIIVIHRGHLFAIEPVTKGPSGEICILSAPEIERQLAYIEAWCKTRGQGPGVGALTTGERSDWAEWRNKLIHVNPSKNSQILDRIEKSLSVLVLDDHEPQNEGQILELSMKGEPRDRWADKSITSIAFRNGTFGASADHTPYDGFCTGIMTHYLMTSVEECGGCWQEDLASEALSSKATYKDPQPLEFDLNAELKGAIDEACVHFHGVCSTVETLHQRCELLGKELLKEHRLHPEAFVQCAIHAAYYKQHGRMAPAYVTASTRRFHNGRTETCRSCYPEMRQFVEHLALNGARKPKETYDLLRNSVERFQRLMEEASSGHGCDRHLLGLYLVAMLQDKPVPELFEDELVRRTNDYILSTSCSGYWNVCGGVPPLVEDGYGCFYGIEDEAITFCCTAYSSCPATDLKSFYQNLYSSMGDMHKILLNSKL